MEHNQRTKEYLEKLGQIKLSSSARARIEDNLDRYTDFHTSPAGPEVVEAGIFNDFSVWLASLKFDRKTVPALAVVAVMLIGSTSFAAQGSVPGDWLYPVKISFNEKLRGALAVGADAESKLQADLLAERIKEAEYLQSTGRLRGALAVQVESNLATQYQKALAANTATETNVRSDNNLSVLLGRLASLSIERDVAVSDSYMAYGDAEESAVSAMTMGVPARRGGGIEADTDMAISTKLAIEPINVAQLMEQNETRLESLQTVINRHKNEFASGVYAELTTALNEAKAAMIEVMVQSNLDLAQEYAFAAADLIGQVEASLSLMGEVTINPDTGVIVDVDLSKKPPVEPTYEVDPMPIPLPMPPDIMVESEVEAEF